MEEYKFKKSFTFSKVDDDLRIVAGIVHMSDYEDLQGDEISREELVKAMERYMMESQQIKIMHKTRTNDVKIIESFYADEQTTKFIGGEKVIIPAGAWYLALKVMKTLKGDEIWRKIKAKIYKGFSLGGRAQSKNIDVFMAKLKGATKKLYNILIDEISLVDFPAVGIQFLVYKNYNDEEEYDIDSWDMDMVQDYIQKSTNELIFNCVGEYSYAYVVKNLGKIEKSALSSAINFLTECGIIEDENDKFSETRKKLSEYRHGRRARLSRNEKLNFLETILEELMQHYKN